MKWILLPLLMLPSWALAGLQDEIVAELEGCYETESVTPGSGGYIPMSLVEFNSQNETYQDTSGMKLDSLDFYFGRTNPRSYLQIVLEGARLQRHSTGIQIVTNRVLLNTESGEQENVMENSYIDLRGDIVEVAFTRRVAFGRVNQISFILRREECH